VGKPKDDETTVSQRTVSDVEKAYTGATNLSAGRVFSLIDALEWTPQQFTEATGLNLPGIVLHIPGTELGATTTAPTLTIETPGDRLKKIREDKDLTPEHVAELSGNALSARRLHNLEEKEGAWQKVTEDEATALARAYGMSLMDFLNTVNGTPFPAKPNIYTDQVVLENPNLRHGTKLVPEYSMVGMGPGGKDGEILGYIDVPESWAGEHVGYRVFGDSMSPKIEEDDTVVVKVQSYASPKNIIVCWIPEEGMVCKYLREITDDGLHVLTSYNPAHPPIWTKELRIYGLVREVRSRVEIINGNHS
jgi:transcriptional regulator with XRE-family HTH domain